MDILQYESKREQKQHGDSRFPYNIYPCSIPLDFHMVPVHWHEEMELISIKKGQGQVTLDLKPFSVEEGDLVVVFPGRLHSISRKPGHSMEYENIIFRLDMLMPALPDACSAEFLMPLLSEDGPEPYVCRAGCREYEAVQQQVQRLDRISGERPYGYELAVKGIFCELLFQILGEKRWKQEPSRRPDAGQRRLQGKVKLVLKEVENRYGEDLSIGEMADLCGYSSSHFMKFFKQWMGTSFVDYLNEYRLIMAARLLLCGEKNVTEIAQETGFGQTSYFNRLFKRKHGMTPGEYRKQCKMCTKTE
ncbi:MAG: AraC family transcriptional regulator [Lachnospiraceae bacterium]|nr:AraC family transcriptional regulator [Lachnospiraceae bacterium]